MSLWAQNFSINDFPKSLSSLETTDPTPQQISKDYNQLLTYYSHPVFSSYMPTYEEMRKDYIGTLNTRLYEMEKY